MVGATTRATVRARPLPRRRRSTTQAIGLWDDGPCDPSKPPLKIGLMTVFESPVISLKDQATALEASATAFNKRGRRQRLVHQGHHVRRRRQPRPGGRAACARSTRPAWWPRSTTRAPRPGRGVGGDGQREDPADRVERDQRGLGRSRTPIRSTRRAPASRSCCPQALIDQEGRRRSASSASTWPRPRRSRASSASIYKGKATFPADIPVPGGHHRLQPVHPRRPERRRRRRGPRARRAGGHPGGEGRPAARAPTCVIGSSLGTLLARRRRRPRRLRQADGRSSGRSPPATADLPVYKALRADLAASGDEALQPENLKASPMRSWIGLYATAQDDPRRQDDRRSPATGITDDAATRPRTSRCSACSAARTGRRTLNHPGLFKRAGHQPLGDLQVGPEREGADGSRATSSRRRPISFDKVLCGSHLRGPEPC